jgi:hypothetical protein
MKNERIRERERERERERGKIKIRGGWILFLNKKKIE